MKDCTAHIFSNGSSTLINDSKQTANRLWIIVILLLGFITPHFVQAQHLDNRKRLDSFQRARTATGATILKILANSYNVTGGGAYCAGGNGLTVVLDGSQLDTTYQLQLNGSNIGSPVTGDGNPISFGLQTAAGTYTVYANTINGPVAMNGSATIVINPLPTPSAGSNTPQCTGSTLNLNASGGSSYSWTGPNGFTSNAQNPSIANVTTAASGIYTVVVTDGNGCSATTTTNVTINALPTPAAGSNTPQCAGSTLNLNASGGSSYSWTGPNGFTSNAQTPSLANITTAASGIYTVVVTDGNGCSATTTTNVTINALPTPAAGSNTPQCTGSTLNLNASGGSTYSWTGPNGFTSNAQNPSITNLTSAAGGTYTVIVTDGNGCSATATTNVTINALPTATAGSNTPQCAGATLNLTASGGVSYSWTGPNGFTSNAQNPSITNLTSAAGGTYTVIVTDGNGCSATTTTNVTINALPTPSAGSNTPQCAGSTLNLNASGGSSYSWTGPNGFTSNAQNPSLANVTTAASGIYTVVVTDGNGCSATTTTNVTINALPTPAAGSNTPQCAGSTLNLTASGGVSYSWTGPNGFMSNAQTPSITNLSTAAAGIYTVIVTDGNSCSATTTTNVAVTPLPTAAISYSATPYCISVSSAQAVTLSGTNAYLGGTFTASPGGLSINASTGAITPSASTAGTYTVTYTTPASGGCATVSTAASVTITAVPTASFSYTGTPFCTTVSSAPVTLTGTGAYTGGTYTAAPGGLNINSTSGDINPSASTPGSYTVTYAIPASGGCAAVNVNASVTITAQPTVTLSYAGTPFCRSLATGQAATLGGTGTYTSGTYSATPGGLSINASTGAITPSTSTAGTYTVTYTTPASGGCATVSTNATITITAVPTATISYTGTPFCTTVSSAPVTLSGTGAYTGGTFSSTAGLTINSSTGEITPSSSTAGSYTVTYAIPASGGCAAVNVTTSVTITAQPTVTLSYAGTPFCRSLATGQAATLGGTGAYTGGTYTASPGGLSINGSTGAITPSASTAGTYTVTYTTPASGGCATVSTNATVTITAVPTATISYTGTPFCTTAGTAPVTLTGTGAYTGGTYTAAPAGLTINSSTGEITPSSSTAGSYTVTYAIPASGGCAAVNVTTPVTITAQPTANLSYAGTPFCRSLATGQNPVLTGTNAYTGGTYSSAPAGLSITAAGVITPSTSTAGTYTVTYTKAAAGGCAAVTASTSVTITAVPTATISYSGTPFCTTVNSAPVTLTGTGAYTGGTYTVAPAGLTINSSTGEITPSTSTAGSYTVTYAIPASGGCAAVNVSTPVTITAQATANLSYAGTPFCRSLATTQNPVLTGTNAYTGGTYSAAPAGLSITTAGVITPSTSTAGTYTVTYTKAAAGGCAAVTASTSVIITAVPTATISYTGTPFCTTVSSALVTITGTGAYTGGTYTAAPAGLTINSSTGEITPSSSTAGSYTITYAIPASGGCAAVNVTTPVTITAQATANLSYAGTPFCRSLATTQNPVLTGTNAYTGGTYSATPAGLSITAAGVITPSTSTAGTYTVTYTKAATGGCAAVTASTSVIITAVPTATISYTGTPFCTTVSSAPVTLTGTGAYTGGTYTAAPAGLTINSSTGEITPSSSTAGTYTVTYAIPASGGCAAVNVTASVTITAMPTASLSYNSNPFCRSVSTAQTPTLTGTGVFTGGTYSAAPGGLTINSGTGNITPSSSIAGTYTVTYTKPAANGCAGITATTSVTITAVPTATISYTGTPFCTTVSSAPVTLTGTGAYTGGTYTAAPAGLTINSSIGEITPSSSTAGSYTVTYAIPASGGCAAVNVTASVTITAMPTASLSYSGNPFCRSVSTAQTPTLTGTGVFTGGTYSSAPGGLTINSGTGNITPSSSTAGTYTVTYTKPAANGCAGITATTSVTITSAPTATISYAGTPFCTSVSAASVTLSGTGAYTGGTFSAPAGLSINSTTGAITPPSSTAGTYTITYTVPASGGCAAVNATTSVTINASPTVSVTPPSAAFCSGNSVTLTASGASTYTWSPSTNLSITTGSIVNAYPDVTTTYTVTGTAANGCTGTASVPITVTASPEGDLSSSPPVCPGSNSGTITLSNYTGTILRWETSTDGGTNWTTVNNTGTTLPYLNLTTTTIYRVYLQLNSCFAYSHVGIVPVNPPFTPTVTVTPASICPGQTATLKASDYGAPPFPVEDFQNANPAGWSGNDANNNNKGDNSEWGETGNGKTFNGLLWNSNAPPTNSKYMIVNGTGGGTIVSLITPPFSLVGLTNPIFNYYTAMNLNAGTTAWVEITTDGTNYNTLKTYTGPTNVGNPNNGFIQESINLSAYIGQPNVKVRFRYSGTAGSNWGVDNVGLGGTYQPVTYQWSPLTYLTPANGVGQTVTTTPTVSGTYNYCVVATTAAGCSSSPVCADVLVKPLPACSISGTDSVCPASTNTYSAPASLNAYSWSITGKGTISGSSTGQTVSVLAARTCGTYTLNLTTTLNGCTSTCSRSFTIYDTTRPVITVTASGTVGCNPAAAAITAAFGTATVTDNCTTGLTAAFTTGAEQGTGCIRTVTRTWTVTDSCGNSATASQTVSFTRDTQGPTFTGVPANATVQCDGIPAAPAVTANDNCSPSVAVTYGEVANVVEGCGTITRTWTSTDLCGNTSTATQTLTVVDTTRPVLTGVPANETVQCTNTIIAGASVTATDNCDPTITVNFSETNNVVQGCGTITRTWTATDNCGNTATATQIVTVIDNTPPVAAAPATQNFQCLADVPAPGTLTATDNCSGNITATGVDVQVANGCGYTITRTWTFTDACNNTSSVSQIINVLDNIPPVITCPPAQVFCAINSNTYTIPPATATDNCIGTLNITYQITGATTRNGTGNDASGVFNIGISTITWTVTDVCGNTATCTTTVTINPKPAPTIFHN